LVSAFIFCGFSTVPFLCSISGLDFKGSATSSDDDSTVALDGRTVALDAFVSTVAEAGMGVSGVTTSDPGFASDLPAS
jgi:hypothetical protein